MEQLSLSRIHPAVNSSRGSRSKRYSGVLGISWYICGINGVMTDVRDSNAVVLSERYPTVLSNQVMFDLISIMIQAYNTQHIYLECLEQSKSRI